MPDYSKRTGYAPWSLTREAGVQSATVNGTIEVPQTCQPTINTGVIDEKGNWQGVKASDEVFIGITTAEAIADGANFLFPDTNNFPSIDMTGFRDLQICLKPSNGGNVAIKAVLGPDTEGYANLKPIASGNFPRLAGNLGDDFNTFASALDDSAESLTVDVWNIFTILGNLRHNKNFQIQIVNNTGSPTTFQAGFMRLV
jgi:hypothetical protein